MPKPENLIPHQMKPGQTLNPNGRPRKLVSHVNAELKAKGIEPISASQVKDCFMMLINLDIEEVKQIAQADSNYPFLYKLCAKELLGKRGADMLEKVLDRAIGKAKQQIEAELTIKPKPDWLDAAE